MGNWWEVQAHRNRYDKYDWALPLFAESLCKFLPLTTNKIPFFMALPAFFMRPDTRYSLIETKDNSTYKSLLLGTYISYVLNLIALHVII